MKKGKSYTQEEMAQIKLEISRNVLLTFRDIWDLKDIKRWADTKWEEHLTLWDYMEKLRMQSLECGRPDLFEEWKKDNLMSFLSFQSLNELKDKMHVKICEFCGIAFQGINKTRMYCSDLCKLRAFNKKKKKTKKT